MTQQAPDKLIDLFLTLAAINATSGAEKPVADFIRQYLAGSGISVREDDAHKVDGGNCGNLICRVGTGGETVLLAHMDTARPTVELKPQVHTDRITSDGHTILGADNRAGVAALLSMLELAAKQPASFRDFTVVFTICEETTLSGSRQLSLDKKIKAGYALDSSLRPGHFIHSTYGSQRFTAEVTGRAVHSALEPEKGINAIWAASRAISTLQMGRQNGDVIVNIGTFSGGTAVNVVPGEAVIKGEVRGPDMEQVEATIEHVAERFSFATEQVHAALKFTSVWDFEPYRIEAEHEIYQRLVAVLTRLGLDPLPHHSPGGSDANSLNARGIAAMNIGIGAQKPHANDEYILIEDLVNTMKIAQALVQRSET
jgi:tripeptide aminopeptidase